MKKKAGMISVLSISLLMIGMTSISAKVGWVNEGWSGANWMYKACNSKTTVYDSPKYSYMSATAEIGSKRDKKDQSSPSANTSVHAVANSGYNETCYTWGNATE